MPVRAGFPGNTCKPAFARKAAEPADPAGAD